MRHTEKPVSPGEVSALERQKISEVITLLVCAIHGLGEQNDVDLRKTTLGLVGAKVIKGDLSLQGLIELAVMEARSVHPSLPDATTTGSHDLLGSAPNPIVDRVAQAIDRFHAEVRSLAVTASELNPGVDLMSPQTAPLPDLVQHLFNALTDGNLELVGALAAVVHQRTEGRRELMRHVAGWIAAAGDGVADQLAQDLSGLIHARVVGDDAAVLRGVDELVARRGIDTRSHHTKH